mmetsp:Transcript_5302/g.10032  ORF Transcript_5302/g.10032 Transcript_5302/m.10032 type:complete len:129 (+) Transcript_5302:434-820(+)
MDAHRCDEFPAFFTPSSGCKVSCRVDTPDDAAGVIKAVLDMNLGSGIVFGVPIPKQFQGEADVVQGAIDQALQEAAAQNIQGSEVTPFLLERVQKLSGGVSLTANIALVKHNAHVGAMIARSLATLDK